MGLLTVIILKKTGTAASGNVVLTVENTSPVITNNGADGDSSSGGYVAATKSKEGTDDTFDAKNYQTAGTSNVTLFTVDDDDNDKLTTNYEWELWKNENNTSSKVKDITQSNLQSGKINIYTINTDSGQTATDDNRLVNLSNTEIKKYYLKVSVKTNDGLGGKDEQKDVIFHFTKSESQQ